MTAGSNSDMRMPMMAITTSNSTSVNPFLDEVAISLTLHCEDESVGVFMIGYPNFHRYLKTCPAFYPSKDAKSTLMPSAVFNETGNGTRKRPE